MPRTRKPQASTPSLQWRWRAANTTTSSLPQVYRFGTWKVRSQCKWPTSSVTVESPLHVQIVGDNVYHVTLNTQELANKLWQLNNLDLSNVNVQLNTVSWPVTLNWNLTVDWEFTWTRVNATEVVATTWNISNVTSSTVTTTTLTAENANIDWLTVNNNASVWGALWVTWATTLADTLTIVGNVSAQSDLSVAWNIQSDSLTTWTWNISTLSAWSTSTTTLDVLNWATVANGLTVTWWETVDTITTTWAINAWTDVNVWRDLVVNWHTNVNTITADWLARFTDVAVNWNETVAWTLAVTWASTFNDSLTVAWASTLSGNTSVWGNLSVAGNSTVTWNQTVTGDAIFNNNITVANDMTVSGDMTVTDDLTVNWNTSLKTLETDGSVDIDWTLRVTWAINGLNWLTVTGQVESDTVRTWEVIADEVRVTDWLYLSNWAEAPDFVLQSEKNQPNGVAWLDANGKIDNSLLPPVYTSAIVKMGTWVFNNSDTSVVVDADIRADSFVVISNYQDIIWDLNETINVWQLTVVSNQTETGSYKYIVVNALS